MAFLTETEKQRISEAIKRAELKTSGELVAVVARASDSYLYIPLLWASLIALLVPGLVYVLVYWLDDWSRYSGMGLSEYVSFPKLYLLQVLVFATLALLFRYTSVDIWLVPKAVKHARARKLAHQQFFEQGLHMTRDRTGILFFVSVAEHYVEVLADSGINSKVNESEWQSVVSDFVVKVKQKQVCDGFIEAIDHCGNVLATHCPRREDDQNELSDSLIELPNHLIEL